MVLEVRSCGGEPAITELDESEDEVRIAVEATTRPVGETDECLDSVEARLATPLRGRVLVDGSSGQTVEVQRSE